MKKIFYLLVACLCMLLPVTAVPQARYGKHAKHNTAHKKQKKFRKPSHKKRNRSVRRTVKKSSNTGKARFGTASYYKDKFTGRKTANGDKYSQKKLTAACNTVPLGTILKVTNLQNNRSVTVTVNDRMHHRNRRLVDISKAAASRLRMLPQGTARVEILIIGKIKPLVKRK